MREDDMREVWKQAAMAGAGAAAVVYTEIRQRMMMLRAALTRGEDRVPEEQEETFPASDPPSHTATAGPQVAH
jgi:hypothetical protein